MNAGGSTHDFPLSEASDETSPLGHRLRAHPAHHSAIVAPGSVAGAAPPDDTLGVYVGTLDAAQLEKLRAAGIDSHESILTPAPEPRPRSRRSSARVRRSGSSRPAYR